MEVNHLGVLTFVAIMQFIPEFVSVNLRLNGLRSAQAKTIISYFAIAFAITFTLN